MKCCALMVLLFLSFHTSSYARPYAGGSYEVLGVGTTSCGQYVSNFDNPQWKSAYKDWIGGFVTGINYSSREIYDVSGGVDAEAMLQFILNFCKEKPLQKVSSGAHYLVEELYEGKQYKAKTKDQK